MSVWDEAKHPRKGGKFSKKSGWGHEPDGYQKVLLAPGLLGGPTAWGRKNAKIDQHEGAYAHKTRPKVRQIKGLANTPQRVPADVAKLAGPNAAMVKPLAPDKATQYLAHFFGAGKERPDVVFVAMKYQGTQVDYGKKAHALRARTFSNPAAAMKALPTDSRGTIAAVRVRPGKTPRLLGHTGPMYRSGNSTYAEFRGVRQGTAAKAKAATAR